MSFKNLKHVILNAKNVKYISLEHFVGYIIVYFLKAFSRLLDYCNPTV